MKQAIQLCCLIVLLFCNSIYAQSPSTNTDDAENTPLAIDCSTVTPGGTMNQQSLQLTLDSLVFMAGQGNLFGTSTEGAGANAVQGVYYCRGNGLITAAQCETCVRSAAENLKTCTVGNSGIAWYAACTVRVANFALSGVLQVQPFAVVQPNPDEATPDPSAEQDRLRDLIFVTLAEAKADSTLHFSSNFIQFGPGIRYDVMAQCSPDIGSGDCQTCFDRALGAMESPDACPQCRPGPLAFVLLPSCQVMFGFE